MIVSNQLPLVQYAEQVAEELNGNKINASQQALLLSNQKEASTKAGVSPDINAIKKTKRVNRDPGKVSQRSSAFTTPLKKERVSHVPNTGDKMFYQPPNNYSHL